VSRPESHIFRRVKYKIRWKKPRGEPDWAGACGPPVRSKAVIDISPRLQGKYKLWVLIDEAIHACHWDLDNDCVDQTSKSISEFLWKCGLRFKDE
jgi:hypothetical protein